MAEDGRIYISFLTLTRYQTHVQYYNVKEKKEPIREIVMKKKRELK